MSSGAVDTSERSGNGSGFTGQRSPTAKMNVWREARFPRAPSGDLPQNAGLSVIRVDIDRHKVAVLRIIKFW